jgi:phage-related protein
MVRGQLGSLKMSTMQTVFYRAADGSEPVSDFLDGMPPAAAAAVLFQIDRVNMLSDTDPPLPFPHSSQVDGELRELRCHYGRRLVRILYRRSEGLFILLHAFEKTTAAVPAADRAVAQSRWDDFRRRMDERPRRPPRAAGHDVP